MKVLKWILIVIAIIVATALIIALFLPKTVTVSATTEVNQPQATVFHLLGNFTERQKWDPWLTQEPEAEVIINPVDEYVGSTYEWAGKKIGSGKMEVASVNYPDQITSWLWFGDMPDTSVVVWDIEASGESTNLTWGFTSDAPYPMGRIFLNLMKGRLQSDFESGLSNLKKELDGKEIQISTLSEITETEIPEKIGMVSKASGKMEELIVLMGDMFTATMETASAQGLQITGPPFTYYTDYNPEDQTTTMYCGVPVAVGGDPTEDVAPVVFPASKAIMAVHNGPYEEFEKSYSSMMKYVEENQIPINYNAIEVYLIDPMAVEFPALYQTAIYFELKD